MAFRLYRKCLYFTLGPWKYLLPDFLLRHSLLPVHPVYFSQKWSFTGLYSLRSYCFKILFLCSPASSSLFTHGYSMRTQSHYDSFSRFYRLYRLSHLHSMFEACLSDTCWSISCLRPWGYKNIEVICIYSLIRKYLDNDRSSNSIIQGEWCCTLYIPIHILRGIQDKLSVFFTGFQEWMILKESFHSKHKS